MDDIRIVGGETGSNLSDGIAVNIVGGVTMKIQARNGKWITGLILLLAVTACSGNNQQTQSGFPAVNDPYSSEEAAQNGDVVHVHGTFLNLDKWDGFLRNVEDKKEDRVRLTQYTIEGDPIFYELVYDG